MMREFGAMKWVACPQLLTTEMKPAPEELSEIYSHRGYEYLDAEKTVNKSKFIVPDGLRADYTAGTK